VRLQTFVVWLVCNYQDCWVRVAVFRLDHCAELVPLPALLGDIGSKRHTCYLGKLIADETLLLLNRPDLELRVLDALL